ncbi:MAG: Rrf2 family transcriptional regulator [Candidatus Moraniibacteriota bacterium]
MKVSKKAYYGLRAMLALANEQEPLSGHDLAKRESMPEEYVEKILQELRRGGFIVSHKGTRGGYVLAKAPCDLNLWEILTHLDGKLKIYAPNTPGTLPCFQVSHCQTNLVFRLVEQELEQSLSRVSLQTLAEQAPILQTA